MLFLLYDGFPYGFESPYGIMVLYDVHLMEVVCVCFLRQTTIRSPGYQSLVTR